MSDKIIIKGAKENNLKNINIELPKNKLIVMTGVSGSGKTSLAFDTIYAEGQRRYVESLSAYARQFLGGLEKPDVDSIEGLSPAISIDQKSTSKNPRSTVGTITEIYDYLRLLFARIGVPYCPEHKIPIVSQSIDEIVSKVMEYEEGTKIQIMSPIVRRQKGTHKDTFEKLKKDGYVRVRVDGEIHDLDDEIDLEKNKNHNIEVVIDRLVINSDIKPRLSDSIETALNLSYGKVIVDVVGKGEVLFSENYACPYCDFSLPELEPRLFSFNAPLGACPECKGLGTKLEIVEDLILNKEKTIREGAIIPYAKSIVKDNIYGQMIESVCNHLGIDMDKKVKNIKRSLLEEILYGTKDEVEFKIESKSGISTKRKERFEGVVNNLKRRYMETSSSFVREWIEGYMVESECPLCHGARLSDAVLNVYINKKNIYDLTTLSIKKLADFFKNIKLTEEERKISNLILKEIEARLKFLIDVGLEYLTLSRSASTLSGGEAQRIRLATQIGSRLSGVLYVLDEPSIGLHQRDNKKLIDALLEMRDLGNTLIVVEHDEEMMRSADFLVDIGPGAGINGGEIVALGTPAEVSKNPKSITGAYLSGKRKIEVPKTRRKGNGKFIEVIGAKENNLKNIDVKFPLGKLIAVTGVSGSGKSTLVNEILYKAIASKLYRAKDLPGKHKEIKGLENIDKVVKISQSPIGRTPRSNPATYVGVFDNIRDLFSKTSEAKIRGYEKGRFSFNVKGGRCEACNGDGVKKIEMHFLPDVYIPCEVCKGTRYSSEVLEIKYKGKNIADILKMTVQEADTFFENIPSIENQLRTMIDVGLVYIELGQPAPTLSGGEAQRVKLAKELQKKPTGKSLFILDEPTTGLHAEDIKKLIKVLERIVDNGDTVIIIEHNLNIIKTCDYIIDLGPEGGEYGGEVIATGTPEELSKMKHSYTGQFLRNVL